METWVLWISSGLATQTAGKLIFPFLLGLLFSALAKTQCKEVQNELF
jgi:hypothetical protein